jgi:hypothetical protein
VSVESLTDELAAVMLRRYELERAGADWNSPEVLALTYEIADLGVERSRLIQELERRAVHRQARIDSDLYAVADRTLQGL